jgi:hypothetical protein
LTAEVARATARENEIADGLNAESERAKTAESALAQSVENEATARQNADAAEQSARVAGDAQNAVAISNEAARATATENGLQSAITAEVAARETAVTADATARQAADSAEQTSRIQGDAVNAAAIQNETSRAQTAEQNLADGIAAEAERATQAEQDNAAAISAEATRAQAAEQNLADGIAAETGRATQAEQQNATDIQSEVQRATQAEQANGTAIEAEDLIASDLTAEVQRAQAAEQANVTAVQNEATRAQTAEATKVDKVTGKGLSTEDYTSAEKTKLASLEKSHAKTTTEYGAASKTAYGHAKFYGNANGDSTELLANPTYEHFYNSAFDCNDYKTAGRVYQNHARSGAGATVNGPLGNTTDKFALEVYTLPGDSAAVLQRYVSITNNREFVRKYNGAWSEWQEFAFKGDITSGAATEAMNYKGMWSATATYKKGDVVVGDTAVSGVDALSTWVSLVDGNANHIPPYNTNSGDDYWRIIGSYGASGFIGRCRYPEVSQRYSATDKAKKRGLILTDADGYNPTSIWSTLAVLRESYGQITSEPRLRPG